MYGFPHLSSQEHILDIADQIANEHACSVCGSVRVLNMGYHCRDEDMMLSTLEVTLLSQDELPVRDQVSLVFANLPSMNFDVSYTVSGKFFLMQPPPPPPPGPPLPNMQRLRP